MQAFGFRLRVRDIHNVRESFTHATPFVFSKPFWLRSIPPLSPLPTDLQNGLYFEQSHSFCFAKILTPRATLNRSLCLTSSFQPNLFALILSPSRASRTSRKRLPEFHTSVDASGHAKQCEERVIFLNERRSRSLFDFLGRKPFLVRNHTIAPPRRLLFAYRYVNTDHPST